MSQKDQDINAQTLRKTGQLDRLLSSGRQHDYERELEFIRSRRRQGERARSKYRAERSYAESVERVEQSDYDPMDED